MTFAWLQCDFGKKISFANLEMVIRARDSFFFKQIFMHNLK